MGHHIRVNCGDCNRLFYCNGKDLTCAECKAYPSNTDNTDRPKPKENEMNKLPDPYQPFGKDTATCIRCTRLYNSRENPGTMICPACDFSGQNKIYEVTRKTCSICKTIWAFTPEADKTKCPHCNQLYERTESVRQEERNAIASNKENHKIIESLVSDLVLENNNLLAKVNHNNLRIATLKTLMETLK